MTCITINIPIESLGETLAVGNSTDGYDIVLSGGTSITGPAVFTGSVSVENNVIQNVANPLSTQDAATKSYVDSQIGANNSLSEILFNGNTTDGYDIVISGGDVVTSEDGSDLVLETAISPIGSSGNVYVQTLSGAINTGALYLQTANAGTGSGGQINVSAGSGPAGGGSIVHIAGLSSANAGGYVSLRAGAGLTDGGYADVKGGNSTGAGSGGYATLIAGDSVNGYAGYINIRGGNSTTGAGGNVNQLGGTGANGGSFEAHAGTGTVTYGGNMYFYAGNGVTAGGDASLTGGSASAGSGGNLSLSSGNGTTRAGWVSVYTGNASAADGGDIILRTGTGAVGYHDGYVRFRVAPDSSYIDTISFEKYGTGDRVRLGQTTNDIKFDGYGNLRAVKDITLAAGQEGLYYKCDTYSVTYPTDIVSSNDGFVWVVNSGSNSISQIDIATGIVTSTVAIFNATNICYGGGYLWVTKFNVGFDQVCRVDPATGIVAPEITVGSFTHGILYADGFVWVTDAVTPSLTKIDPVSCTVVGTGTARSGATTIEFADGYIWVVNQDNPGSISKFEPAAVTEVALITGIGNSPEAIAFDGTYLWVSAKSSSIIYKIDPSTDSVVGSISGYAADLVFDGTYIWGLNFAALFRLVNDQYEFVVDIPGSYGEDMCFDGQNIWASGQYSNEVAKISPVTPSKLINVYGNEYVSGNLTVDGYTKINNDLAVTGKLYLDGLIDPSGVVLNAQSSVPGGVPEFGRGTIWLSDDGYFVSTDYNGVDTKLSSRTLADTLADGNITGPNDIEVSTGSKIIGTTDLNINSGTDGNIILTPGVSYDYEIDAFDSGGINQYDCTVDGSGYIWYANYSSVTKINPVSGAVIISIACDASAICFGDGYIWTAFDSSSDIIKINPDTNSIEDVISVVGPFGLLAVAYGDGYIWASDPDNDVIVKINSASDIVEASIPVSASYPAGIVYAGGYVWVALESGSLSKIDPIGNVELLTIVAGASLEGISYDGTYLWTTDIGNDTVIKINPTSGLVEKTIAVVTYPKQISFFNSIIWIAGDGITRIDQTTEVVIDEITAHNIGECITNDGTSIWTSYYYGWEEGAYVKISSGNGYTEINDDLIVTDLYVNGDIEIAASSKITGAPDVTIEAKDGANGVNGGNVTLSPGISLSYKVERFPLTNVSTEYTIYNGYVWYVDSVGHVCKVNSTTGSVVGTISVGSPCSICSGDGYIWAGNSNDSNVNKIDPNSVTVVDTIATTYAGVRGITFDGYIWATNSESTGRVVKIDPGTDTVVDTVITSGADPFAIVYANNYIWVTDSVANIVSKIDPVSDTEILTIAVGNSPRAISYDGTYLWVSNFSGGTVSKINPISGLVINTIAVGVSPKKISFFNSLVWVGCYHSFTLIDPLDDTVTGTYLFYGWANVSDGTLLWTDDGVSEFIKLTTGNDGYIRLRDGNGTNILIIGDGYLGLERTAIDSGSLASATAPGFESAEDYLQIWGETNAKVKVTAGAGYVEVQKTDALLPVANTAIKVGFEATISAALSAYDVQGGDVMLQIAHTDDGYLSIQDLDSGIKDTGEDPFVTGALPGGQTWKATFNSDHTVSLAFSDAVTDRAVISTYWTRKITTQEEP